MVVFVVLLGVHGVVVLVFIVKVVVGVVGQVAQADGDDGGNVGVNFFRTPLTTTQTLNKNKHRCDSTLVVLLCVLPPDEGLKGLDAVLSELVIVNVTKLHDQRNDLLQILSYRHTECFEFKLNPDDTTIKRCENACFADVSPILCPACLLMAAVHWMYVLVVDMLSFLPSSVRRCSIRSMKTRFPQDMTKWPRAMMVL